MNSALRSRTLVLGFALVAGVGTLVVANSAQAQDPGTGAAADKDCPGVAAELGQTITCNFTVVNTGDFPAQVTALTEQSPFPSGDMVDISCTAGGTVISEGGTLAPDVACRDVPGHRRDQSGDLQHECARQVGIELLYTTGFPQPLTAGAFATHVTLIVCPADIEITKTADELCKVATRHLHFNICNVGDATVNRGSVTDTCSATSPPRSRTPWRRTSV